MEAVLSSTCGSVGSIYKLKLKHGHYTHVFVDEAGHVTEPECLIPLGRGLGHKNVRKQEKCLKVSE